MKIRFVGMLSLIAVTASAGQARAQAGATTGAVSEDFVEPSSDDYISAVVAAAGWARKTYRLVGVLQQTNGHPLWQVATEAATKKYSLRAIELSDFQPECRSSESQQRIAQQKTVCKMKGADVVLQFNAVRMSRDSSWVALSVTRVAPGTTRVEMITQCVTLGRKGSEWEARRAEPVMDFYHCPRR